MLDGRLWEEDVSVEAYSAETGDMGRQLIDEWMERNQPALPVLLYVHGHVCVYVYFAHAKRS